MASPFEPGSFTHDLSHGQAGTKRCDVRLFGSFRVLAADGSNATPAGRKARALIAYLLLADGETVTRDRLAGLLWSERGDDQARASLRQTLYEVRALASGAAALVASDRAQVRIEAGRVVTDLDRMKTAAAASDTATLATLVGDKPPDLLADLDGLDPAFDEWLSSERRRRNDERRSVVLSAVDKAFASGDIDGAHRLAVRLLAADPTDETVARLAMEASHRRGDRDAARQTFGRLQETLRQDLGVAPSDETVALHRRLMSAQVPPRATDRPEITAGIEAANDEPMHAFGNRRPPPAQPDVADDAAASEAVRVSVSGPGTRDPELATDIANPRTTRPFAMAALIALLVVLVVGGIDWWRASSPPPQRLLIVEPFRVATTDAAASPLRNGFAADLAHLLLGNDTRLNVIDSTQSAGTATRDAGFVIEGDAQSAGSMLHVNLKLRRANDETIL